MSSMPARFRHVVMFRWSADATAEAKAALAETLGRLPSEIDAIESYHFGPDAGLGDDNWDFAVVGDFADEAAYVVYRDHERHRAVVTEQIRPIISARASVQYRLDG